MESNVLVADDSLTIQKVVAITLATEKYVLTKALNAEELIAKVKNNNFDLLLLDFNLSDTQSGYELATQVREHNPEIEIMAMLGTFDTVEDEEFSASVIAEKVTKPFESEKFINKCKALIEKQTFAIEEIRGNEQDDDLFGEDDTDELTKGWEVDNSVNTSDESVESIDAKAEDIEEETYEEESEDDIQENTSLEKEETPNLLASELLGWGIEIPPVIGENEEEVSLMPPVIEETIEVESEEIPLNEIAEPVGPKSKLVPLEELSLESDDDFDEDTLSDIDKTLEIIPRYLSNEVESETTDEDFWEVDDNGVGETVHKGDIDDTIEITQTQVSLSELGIQNTKENSEEVTLNTSSINEEELINKLKDSLTPLLKELVRDFCKEKIEQVAWEIIPDLAENLIKQEVKEITEEVKNTVL